MADSSSPHADLAALVASIDDNANPLHGDFTPSVLQLIERGLPGAQAVLGLLDAYSTTTRLHAQRVIEGVVMRRYGWAAGQGYADPDAPQRVNALLAANGSYSADAPEDQRQQSIARWREWIAAQIAADRGGQP